MTVSELSPGMRGVGRTVIKGTDISEFNVEIIDVFAKMGWNGGPLILCRLSGPVVEATGGIAGGFSGSPVFIDGKLIGALSAGWAYTDGMVAAATPINEMLKAFTYPTDEPPRLTDNLACLDAPIEIDGRTIESILVANYDDDISELEGIYGPETMVLTPCKTPLIVSGLNGAAFDKLNEFVQENLPYLDLVQGPGGGSEDGTPMHLGPVDLQPGASVGGQIASGDLDLTAVGTLTWVGDDGRFLAFGHPFLGTGVTNMPFVSSRILYTLPSEAGSFKMGEADEVVGTITQDRLTAVGGYFGQAPDMVDINMKVIDRDIDHTERFSTSVLKDEQWLPILGLITPSQGLSYAMDRMGGATCVIKWSVTVDEFEKPIERENLYFSSYSASDSLMELYELLNMLTAGNMFKEVNISSIDIEIECTSVRQTSDIIRARFQNAPNMGPGAVGYSGPVEVEPDKAEKDRRLSEGTLVPGAGSEEMQEMPVEEPMPWGTDPGYDTGYVDPTMPEMVKYHPGDTIEVLVTLRPWRGDSFDKVIELEIPEDFPAGVTSVEIMGGMYSYYYGMYGGMTDMSGMYYAPTSYLTPPESLEEVVDEFLARDKNNAIVLGILNPLIEDDPYFYLQDNYEASEQLTTSIELGDVVQGYYSLPVEIVSNDAALEGAAPSEEDLLNALNETYTEEAIVTEEGASTDGGGDGNPHRH